jgi:hypothetical protein
VLPDKEQWCAEYLDDRFYNNLQKYTAHVIEYRKCNHPSIMFNDGNISNSVSAVVGPREINLLLYNKFYLDSLYIIDYIRKHNADAIYDIGCGSNMFKFFFDDIVGVDSDHPAADIISTFNKQYAIINKNMFPNAIAINSLHFIPLRKFKQQLTDFANCIKSNGYGYATFNIHQLLSRDINIPKNIEEYIRSEIDSANLNVIDLYINDVSITGNDGLDGNIRILFKVN